MALEILTASEKEQLIELYTVRIDDNIKKLKTISKLFRRPGVPKIIQETIEKYAFKASETLNKINVDENKKASLRVFAENLMERKV